LTHNCEKVIAEREVVLANAYGLHLRPAKGFVERAMDFEVEVAITKDGETVDGRSILSLTSLRAGKGCRLVIRCAGRDAEAACGVLAEYLERLPELPGEMPRDELESVERFPEAICPPDTPAGRSGKVG